MIIYENYLIPILNDQKSYYKKAKIETFNQVKNLYSYGTLMVGIENDDVIYLNEDESCYTETTLKHIKDFLYQYLDYENISKMDILQKMYALKGTNSNNPKIPGIVDRAINLQEYDDNFNKKVQMKGEDFSKVMHKYFKKHPVKFDIWQKKALKKGL